MVKRSVSFLISLLILINLVSAFAANGSETVYITRTGEKYHSAGCGYLKSSIETTLEEAVSEGYTPCSKCSPPRLSSSTKSTPAPTMNYYVAPVPTTAMRYSVTPAPTIKPYKSSTQNTYNSSYSTTSTTSTKKQPFTFNTSTVIFSWLCCLSVILLQLHIIRARGASIDDLNRTIQENNKIKESLVSKNAALSYENENFADQNKKLKTQNERLKKDLDDVRERIVYASSTPDTKRVFEKEIPPYCYVGDDGLPAGPGSKKWGDSFTFYHSHTGTVYHDYYGCSQAFTPINAVNLGDLAPCKRCRPIKPDLSWYYEYIKIRKYKEQNIVDFKQIQLDEVRF